MQRLSGYCSSWLSWLIGGPEPRSYVPSIGTHALTRLRSSNSRERSTHRSRTSGNFVIGSSVIGPPFPSVNLSISAEQLCRTFPLMIIVHAPQTSSKQPLSQTGGVVLVPL